MRVVVTGGAGFIGRWVVASLLARGDEVVVIDDLSNGSMANLAELRADPHLQIVRGDVANPKAVVDAFAGGADLAIHLAAVIEVQKSLVDPARSVDVNVGGTANVLEACRAGDVRATFVSTCMVYDMASARGSISESHPVKPVSPYAATKLAAEHLTLAYGHAYGLPVSVVRPFNTYGPFQKANQEGGVVAIFVRRALRKEPLEVFGDGTQTRDFLYVDDCVDLILRACESKAALGEVLNGGSGRDIAVNDLARLVGGPDGEVVHVSHPHPQSEIQKLRADARKAAKLLGWRSNVSLEDGLARLRRWMAP
jgi:nucleoside-diphosphate-sugar epimerase